MEDKNELSDILLEKDDDRIFKLKRIFIIVAALIILFLIVLLSMKLLNKPRNSTTPKLILPPEPITSVQKTKKDEELFKQVPIVQDNKTKKDNFEKIVSKLKNKAKKLNKPAKTQVKIVATPIEKNTILPVVKPILKQKHKIAIKHSRKEIYIQVGAISRSISSKKFLRKIKKIKLGYRLLKVKIKGKKITKILVGPFKSIDIAKQNISKIKKYINKNAYIYTLR